MKKILFSLMIIGATAAIVVGGTMAYFHDEEVARGNVFTAGTLDLRLRDDWPNLWRDKAYATWVSPDYWAPGEKVTATIWLRNDGTVTAHEVHVDWAVPTGDANFLRAIQVTEMSAIGPGVYPRSINLLPGFVDAYDVNDDEKMSLWELIHGDVFVMRDTDTLGAVTGDPLLIPGRTISLTMGYTFMTENVAGYPHIAPYVVINDLQGARAGFDVTFKATQEDTY